MFTHLRRSDESSPDIVNQRNFLQTVFRLVAWGAFA
jgi:hypothetical protein